MILARRSSRKIGGVKIYRLPLDNSYWPYGAERPARSKFSRLFWHLRNSWNNAAASRLAAVLDVEKPDVVHCNVITGFSPSIWREVKRRRIPLVQTLRDYGIICTRSTLFKSGANCQQRCVECRVLTRPAKKASQVVDQLVSISDFVAKVHLKEGYFLGVPVRRSFNIVGLARREREAKSETDPLAFGFIGRVEVEKGIEIVLEATDRLNREDWTLKIAGVGAPDYVSSLKDKYADPRITWLGYAEAQNFYPTIDTLIVPSVWSEPLGRTVIEALSFGLSLICAEAGGIPETANLARRVIIYEPTDVDALSGAMQLAIDAKADWRIGGLQDEGALELFSEGRIVAEAQATYRDAVLGASR